MNLTELGEKYQTDKVSHGYTNIYESYFESLREKNIRLLEIGIYKGASLSMWKDYFKNGAIFGMDDGTLASPDMFNKNIFRADQKNREQMKEVLVGIEPFDIIVDDGLHYQEHQQISIGFLFGFLKLGGLYVIEDLCPRDYKKNWGIKDIQNFTDITTNVLENFIKTKKFSSIYTLPEESVYLENSIKSIKIHYIREDSIIAFIRKKS